MRTAVKIESPPPTILAVDDDQETRTATVGILEQAGYAVFQGANATEALALTRAQQPALVLLDADLSDGDGRQVARQLKTDTEQVMIWEVDTQGLYT